MRKSETSRHRANDDSGQRDARYPTHTATFSQFANSFSHASGFINGTFTRNDQIDCPQTARKSRMAGEKVESRLEPRTKKSHQAETKTASCSGTGHGGE